MKKLLRSLVFSLLCYAGFAQNLIHTDTSIIPSLYGGGVIFQTYAAAPITIHEIGTVFQPNVQTAEVWIKRGSLNKVNNGNAVQVDSASGWIQVEQNIPLSATNGIDMIPIVLSTGIDVLPLEVVNIYIEASVKYHQGLATDSTLFSDGLLSVNLHDSVAYAGLRPTVAYHPRRFIGYVNYRIGAIGVCSPFTNLNVEQVLPDSVLISWASGNGNTSFELEYGPSGFSLGMGNKINGLLGGSQTSVWLSGLMPETDYDYYLLERCNAGNDSCLSFNPLHFKTRANCPSPQQISIQAIRSDQAQLELRPFAGFSYISIYYGPSRNFIGGANWVSDTLFYPDSIINLNQLQELTEYELYIIQNCGPQYGDGDTIGPLHFKTPIQGPQGVQCDSADANLLFEDSVETIANWTGDLAISIVNSGDWTLSGSSTSTDSTGPNQVKEGSYYLYTETSGAAQGKWIEAITSPISLRATSRMAELSFFLHAYGVDIDTFKVELGTSAQGPWTTVFEHYGQVQNGSNEPWQEVGVDLSNFLGQKIYLRFAHRANGPKGDLAIDFVRLKACQDCRNPYNIQANPINANRVELSWSGSSYSQSDFIIYGPKPVGVGSVNWTIDTVNSGDTIHSLRGLTGSTDYVFYLLSNCGAYRGNSDTIGPFYFRTPIQTAYSLPCPGDSALVFADDLNYETNWSGDMILNPSSRIWKYHHGASLVGPIGPYSPKSGAKYLITDSYYSGGGYLPVRVVSPEIDLSQANGAAVLSFWFFATGLVDTFRVQVGNSPNGPWTTEFMQIGRLQDSYLQDWQNVAVSLNAYLGQKIYLRFFGQVSDNSGEYAIDLVEVSACMNCLSPSFPNLDDLVQDSVHISWSGGPGKYKVAYGPVEMHPDTAAYYDSTQTASIGIGNLINQSEYDFYIRRDCRDSAFGGLSPWIGPLRFETGCASYTAPYFWDFDNDVVGSDVLCWTTIGAQNQSKSPSFTVFQQVNGNKNARLYPNGVDSAWFITPRMSDLPVGDKRLSMEIYASALGYQALIFGTMEHPSKPWTYMPLDTLIVPITYPAQQISFNFTQANGYNGQHEYIVLDHESVYNTSTFYLDNIRYEVIPQCFRPSNFHVINSSLIDTTVALSWTSADSGSVFELEYGIYPLGDSLNTRKLVQGNSDTLWNLLPQTSYCVWIREVCSPLDKSNWLGPVCFETKCLTTGHAVPWFDNFESANIGTPHGYPAYWDNCWWTLETSTWASHWLTKTSTGNYGTTWGTGPYYDHTLYPDTGGVYVFMHSGSSQDTLPELVSPYVEIGSVPEPELYFHYHMHGARVNKLMVFAEDSYGNRFFIDSIYGEQHSLGSDTFSIRRLPLGFLPKSTYRFVFQGHRAAYDSDIALDDIGVRNLTSCWTPYNIQLESKTDTSLALSWFGSQTATWQVEYGPSGFSPGTGTLLNTNISSIFISGLNAGTNYDFRIRQICVAGDTSLWSSQKTFATWKCPLAQRCQFIVELSSAFLSGWSGAIVEIRQNGAAVKQIGADFLSGSQLIDTVSLCPGVQTEFVLIRQGALPRHIRLRVFDAFQFPVDSFLGSVQTPTVGSVLLDFYAWCGANCSPPSNITSLSVGCDSVELTWNGNGAAIVEYGIKGFSRGTGTLTNLVSPPTTITMLQKNLDYDFYLADTCSGDTSQFSLATITTATSPDPIADFTYSSSIVNNEYVLIVDGKSSLYAKSWHWNYGYGVTGTGKIDTVVFQANRARPILLTVTNACGNDVLQKNIIVNIGLNENALANTLNVFPNPASHQVNISFREVGSGDVEIRLRDAQGREVMLIQDRMQSGTYSKDIDVSSLARGIYMVEVKSGGLTAHRRLSIR